MNYATNCKFCKRPIILEVDDDYSSLGDPHGLIPLAACNHCSDVRIWKWTLEDRLSRICRSIEVGGRMNEEKLEQKRKSITKLTKDYARMISRWHFLDGECWDEGVVEAILQQPRKWGSHVGRLWRMFRDWQRQQEQQERMKI